MESGTKPSATIAEAMRSTTCFPRISEMAGLRRMERPGKRLAARLARIPTPIPEEKTRLKPNGRLFSLVRSAMAGEMATAQIVVKNPPES